MVIVGVMLSAVARSIWLDMPSWPDVVLILWVDKSLRTSSCEQVTLGKQGSHCEESSGMLSLTLGEKQVEKNLLSMLAFCKEEVAGGGGT